MGEEINQARLDSARQAILARAFLKKIMRDKLNNYAFIDSQNLNLGVQSLGWKLNYKRFRTYLKEKYSSCKRIKMFIGENKHIGYVYGFRGEDFTDKWLQQDWVEFRLISHLLKI